MLSNIDKDKIKEIENEQKELNKNIPFKVKYEKDYLWQIYYSEYTNKYFMLVPTEDLEYSAFFYLLKEQLKNKNEKIFAPISYTDYSREYLNRTQITDIENYLWLFTKEWPLVYEVYDKNNSLSLEIVGKTYIYEDIQSDYKIQLNTKEDAIKFYKLLKALFILQTELPHHYKFNVEIDKKGSIDFKLNSKKIIYSILSSFIKEEYLKAEEIKLNLTEEKMEDEKRLNLLQKKASELEKEYLEKEKQISIYLEYKKTFLGRVKYFFKYKKVSLSKQKNKKEKEQEVKLVRINKYGDVKSNYTLEELIEIYKQVDKEDIKVKNLKSDIDAIDRRIENLKSKIKNAKLYIEEIDKHKKSIFEFWRFTNKDKISELPEGNISNEKKIVLKKVFDYNLDFEDLSKQLDKNQRELLSKQELDSIYIATTDILKDINTVLSKERITKDRLEEVKENMLKDTAIEKREDFDIFGSIPYDNKLKVLANKKHRETVRELFNILDITKNTTLEEYTELIKYNLNNIESALEKVNNLIEMPVYKCTAEEFNKKTLSIFNIKASETLSDLVNSNIKETNLYKINLKENNSIIALTNIVYYNNTNQTLPLGMDVSRGIILDMSKLNLELKNKTKLNIVTYKEPQSEISSIEVKTIDIEEYVIK